MKYEKQAITFETQADQLIERGLIADRGELIRRLGAVSYFRLAGYLHPYRIVDHEKNLAETHFDKDGRTLRRAYLVNCSSNLTPSWLR